MNEQNNYEIHSISAESIGHKFMSCVNNIDDIFIKGNGKNMIKKKYHPLRIGIVGTRNATPAGIADTRKIAQVISRAGGIIVSGMALGIDGAAHQGALDVSGKTIAVLGSGVDVIYPLKHKRMYDQILESGLIASQFNPGTQALPWHFPVRNSLIVGLCDILVVTEGTLKGGARISVDIALEAGRTVLALPGPRRSYASELCNAVIKDGAGVITDPSDILREMGIDSELLGWEEESNRLSNSISTIHRKILNILVHQKANSYDLSVLTNLSAATIASSLAFLERNQLIEYQRGSYIAK